MPPSLRIVDREPFVVRGTAFEVGELVTVTALTGLGPKKTVVRASGIGSFRAALRLSTQPCGSVFAVRAIGARGSRAVLRLASSPCIPPRRD